MSITTDFQYFLFDWDGCLADSPGIWLKSYQKIYSNYGVEVSDQDILTHSWGNLETGPKHFGIKDYEQAWQDVVDEVEASVGLVTLHEGAVKVLVHLHELGKRIAIVTSSESHLVFPALEANHILKYFDLVIAADNVSKHKPDPECVYKVQEVFGDADNAKYVIIGDTDKDILTGKNAGIATVLYSPEAHSRYYIEQNFSVAKPDLVIRSLKELID